VRLVGGAEFVIVTCADIMSNAGTSRGKARRGGRARSVDGLWITLAGAMRPSRRGGRFSRFDHAAAPPDLETGLRTLS
jgi:hypothetical protein